MSQSILRLMTVLLLVCSGLTIVNGQQSEPIGCSTSDNFPVWSPDGKSIIYYSLQQDNSDIYTIDLESGTITNLTEDSLDIDYAPSWSPDGEHIVFTSNRDVGRDIWVMEADGSNPTNLTPDMRGVQNLAHWSPDGQYITFVSDRYRQGGVTDIWVMEADGSNPTNLTANVDHAFSYSLWMSDSRTLVFLEYEEQAIWSVVIDDPEQLRQLTENYPDTTGITYSVSPIDDSIVFTGTPSRNLVIMNADGGDQRQLTNDDYGYFQPIWSPDGEYIAFNDETFGLSVVSADGRQRSRLTEGSWGDEIITDVFFTWSPDSQSIAFQSRRGETTDIWVINRDGTDMRNLTCPSSE